MSENGGYAAFCLYHALHLHFTTNYDYQKYNGKVNVSKDTFLNRRDKYVHYALSRKYSLEELKLYYIANLFVKPNAWIGDLNTSEAEDVYKKWQKLNQSLTYRLEQDIMYLFNKVKSPNDILLVKDGQEPILLKEVYYGNVASETLILLNTLLNFYPMWQKQISDDVVFPEFLNRCKKYEPFIVYDGNKFKSMVTNVVKSYK
jgi:hypothetical protein